ncbi:glycosyl hydrolase family 18 protein [Pleionea sp. CnH1-48]|uniref:glycosyl hydrolase family 18 protein n=1 Tax=Pleionea sp. CnH1-48 TaxID=2954494 RepID=UPI002096920B|nr:glycosyl hydrolase family 18 protein [Pleionea sp. CnH1-48]MCO7223296.1 glycosyl hydrolase family 18 protein [Pleionea sp. CnH1-48]
MIKQSAKFLFISTSLLSCSAYALNCDDLDNWSSTKVYTGGKKVQHNAKAYTANYWTQNNNPETHSSTPWSHWKEEGVCDGITPPPPPPPPTPIDCGDLPLYQPGTQYKAGDQVYNVLESSGEKHKYTCEISGWCSSSAAWAYEPGNGLHWGQAWGDAGSCSDDGQGEPVDPVAEANGPYQGKVNQSIQFSSSGSGDADGKIVSYRWNFGDGTTVGQKNAEHRYSAAGNYTASLTVTDNDGRTHTDTAQVTIGDDTPPPPPPQPTDQIVLGYFTQWGIYARGYLVKNIVTSGSAEKLTHINYAFGDVKNGRCALGNDNWADFEKRFSAAESVDGKADGWDNPNALAGNFNQLRKLKAMYPHIKVLYSFGGWTYSGGFAQAAKNPQAFAQSCYDLVFDSRWSDVFDGIDIDWEYPNACGLSCDNSGPQAFAKVMAALRAKFGDKLVTAAVPAGADKIAATDYGAAAQHMDFINVMTYDFFGAWSKNGPTAPHSALNSFPSIPTIGYHSDAAIQAYKAQGVPANKIVLGIGFYGRGWSGVTQKEPGGTASGPAPGTYEQGIEDYKVLKNTCPSNGKVGGTAFAHCGTNWYSYDTPETILTKMNYVKSQGLGGAFFWELNGDTQNGELISAIHEGLK